MESFEQGQAAYVADENGAAGLHDLKRAFDHLQQIINAREVLDHGVEHDKIKRAVVEANKVICVPLEQLELRQVFVAQAQGLLNVVKRDGREVSGDIARAMRRKAKQQQAGAATDLQNVVRPQREDAIHRLVQPVAHLLRGDRCSGVAVVPAGNVEGG